MIDLRRAILIRAAVEHRLTSTVVSVLAEALRSGEAGYGGMNVDEWGSRVERLVTEQTTRASAIRPVGAVFTPASTPCTHFCLHTFT